MTLFIEVSKIHHHKKLICVGIILVMFGALVTVIALLLDPDNTHDDSRQDRQLVVSPYIVFVFHNYNSSVPINTCRWIEVNVVFDDYAKELSWDVQRVGVSGEDDTVLEYFKAEESLDSHTDSLCLEEHQYQYTIHNDTGDGTGYTISRQEGYYNLTSYGALIARGAEFALNEIVLFDMMVHCHFQSDIIIISIPTQSLLTAYSSPSVSVP